tara:strand:+ start:139 stop:522 length:384 start_codon:yes stop_codon:yes gene_type:complete
MKNLNVNSVTISGSNKKMFKSFFEIDNDFGDNEEYFRPDTLELGYENEAERCSEELYEKYFREAPDGHEETLYVALEEGANMSVDGAECSTQFILGNSSYVTDYDIAVVCTDVEENEYEVIISYLSY